MTQPRRPGSSDTIAALATAPGRGAIGIVRVSGPDTPRIAAAVLGALPAPRRAVRRRFLDADGTVLDEGLALYFPEPESFTGEPVLELQGHGGPVVLEALLQRLRGLGCRGARPGEFSERAFLNGKLDIAQAEAIADLIDAGSAAAARAAVRSMQGEFSRHVEALQAALTELRVHVEAAIDFPEEEIDRATCGAIADRAARIVERFDALGAAARQGVLLRDGLTVVIAGKPNAGKSSLLNRLVGDAVAIVADLPGTTRDVLREHVHVDGLPLTLIDTAGLHAARDAVEAEGIRRARVEIARADLLLYVVDASTDPPQLPNGLAEVRDAGSVTLVLNKIDLGSPRWEAASAPQLSPQPPTLRVSARTGAGLQELRNHLKAAAGYAGPDAGAFSARQRHLDALARARAQVEEAMTTLRETRAVELFAEHLRLAQLALGEITGEMSSEDLLGEIFASFCIGK